MDYRQFAACKDADLELFFADERETKKLSVAKAICSNCLVKTECFLESLQPQFREQPGVFAGKTLTERNRMIAIMPSLLMQLENQVLGASHISFAF